MTGEPVCQICGEGILEGQPSVVCRACETPHHADCWRFVGGCSTFACACRSGAVAAGEPIDLPARGRRAWLQDIEGRPVDTGVRYSRLDLETPLEQLLQYGAVAVLLLGGFLFLRLGPPFRFDILAWTLPVASLLLLARMVVDGTYVLDNEKRHILICTSVAGWRHAWRLCSFDDVAWTAVSGRHAGGTGPGSWTWVVMVGLRSGVRLQVTDETGVEGQALWTARTLAEHLGCPVHGSPPWPSKHDRDRGELPGVPAPAPSLETPVLAPVAPRWVALFVVTLILDALLLLFH